ncbi:MAG: M23 family metallopeptidase [Desulfatitalea sp.]|nr:peptidoglycan DD-metalloendopeptidase family protein [Desulfatitalea sp.]NNJ99732.1 M23 family metallopeptidase [Desulfatitalea sp.]
MLKRRFTAMLIAANDPAHGDLTHWAFCPGMRFNETAKWWGDFGRRDLPHEGIDLCLYKTTAGGIGRLNARTRIPVMHDGVVRAMFKDFLGWAIAIEHPTDSTGDVPLLSFYAHTVPRANLRVGDVVGTGDLIGTIADTRQAKARILPHLHLTLGRMISPLDFRDFAWNHIHDSQKVALLDPLPILDRPHTLLDTAQALSCL